MQIGPSGSPVSHIAQAHPDRVEVRGGALCDELMGRSSFTQYFHLLLTGSEPTQEQTFFLDVLLVAIAEHGMMPTSVAARVTPPSLKTPPATGLGRAGPPRRPPVRWRPRGETPASGFPASAIRCPS